MFRYYTNMVSHASRNFAGGMLILGLVFVGIGFLILVLRDLFAILFAGLFCVAGIFCGITSIKLFLAARHMDKNNSNKDSGFRDNVSIHYEEHHYQ